MSFAFRFAPGGRRKLHELEELLHAAYGSPEAVLGNHVDPLDEAIYIILSFQTDLPRVKENWQNLRRSFRRWTDVDRASFDDVAAALRPGGLHRQKARAVKGFLKAVYRQFGELSLDALREIADADAERVLTKLPGLSWKGTRCVLLYGLDRQVFPVDVNTFRILKRTGIIPLSSVYRRLSLHNALQDAIEPVRRRRCHVNLVVHGQEVCLPKRPRCGACPARSTCPRRGLPTHTPETVLSRAEMPSR